MGGTAVLIRGTADVERLTKRGVLDRLFGRGGAREGDIGDNRKLIELPSRAARPLIPAFQSYVREAASPPWPATSSVLSYLDIAFDVYVRGERDGTASPAWYVALSFGGCAGMAETSSEVAAHWATRWYTDERERIARLLIPGGFKPSGITEWSDDLTFLPVGDFGYASFRKAGYAIDDERPPTHFEIDTAVTEGNENGAEQLLRTLEREWVGYMADGRCHCQLCDPGFDLDMLASLPLEPGGE